MKFIHIILTINLIFIFNVRSQDTIIYKHCNCIDIIEKLNPIPVGAYSRTCGEVLIEKGIFKAGLKDGEWLSYNYKGILIKKIYYQDGILNGEVSYFYNNGNIKFSGSFSNGLKNGDWKFYNQNEKIQWSQSYLNGIPVGKSLIYDSKGKKIVRSYDFDKKVFEINTKEVSLFKEDSEILQDPISAEWFILVESDQSDKTKELTLDQKNIESQLFMSSLEIPSEIFNTYLNLNYNVEFTFENFGVKKINLHRENAKGNEYPLFAFVVMTNDPQKLSKIQHSEFSLKLLDSKIYEALSIFEPWNIEKGKFNMAFLYVINQIEGR